MTVLSSLSLAFSVMMKEPFLLICIFCAFMFVDNFRDFIKCILIPCICGGVAVLALLTVTGTLVPYFTIYVSHMFETRLSGASSVFSKMKSVFKLYLDLNDFSHFFYLLVMFFIILTFLRPLFKKKGEVYILYHVLRVCAAVLIASLCVGMGGQYYNHHYIFALPLYCSFIIYGGAVFFEFKPKKDIVRKAMIILWGTVLIIAGVIINVSYDNYTNKYESIKAKAEYVDEMMDFYEEDRYQYLGFNGENEFFGLTEHSPLGPVFAQDSNNFLTADTWFAECIKKQMDECDIIIFRSYEMPAMNDYVMSIIDEKFTETPAKKFDVSPPNGFDYKVYFRKSKYA